MHAYQSLLWNKAASKRVKLGHRPIVGDLVFVDKASAVELIEEDMSGAMDEYSEAPPSAEGEELGKEVSATVEENVEEEEKKIDYKALVKPLSQADIDSGAYSMFDVVLPLPGHDIAYPTNEIGAYFEEMMAEDDLSSEKLKQKNK